jgi:hypothetical protein
MASRTSCIAAFMVCLCIQIIRTCILPAFPQFCLFNIPHFCPHFFPLLTPFFYLLSSCFIRAFPTQLPQFSPLSLFVRYYAALSFMLRLSLMQSTPHPSPMQTNKATRTSLQILALAVHLPLSRVKLTPPMGC